MMSCFHDNSFHSKFERALTLLAGSLRVRFRSQNIIRQMTELILSLTLYFTKLQYIRALLWKALEGSRKAHVPLLGISPALLTVFKLDPDLLLLGDTRNQGRGGWAFENSVACKQKSPIPFSRNILFIH